MRFFQYQKKNLPGEKIQTGVAPQPPLIVLVIAEDKQPLVNICGYLIQARELIKSLVVA